MSNPFGGFVHTSPISSPHHDPLHSITSNIIRDYFGPTVQTIADCLLKQSCTGGINPTSSNSNPTSSSSQLTNEEAPGHSFRQILTHIAHICQRQLHEERHMLIEKVNQNPRLVSKRVCIHMAKGPESSGYVVDPTSIRAALLVLIQQSIVLVLPEEQPPSQKDSSTKTTFGGGGGGSRNVMKLQQQHHDRYRYKIDPNRARFIPRYPRYVEHAREAIDDNAAAIIEEVLLHGRMRAEDIVTTTMESVYRYLTAGREEEEEDNDDDDEDNDDNDNEEEESLTEEQLNEKTKKKQQLQKKKLELEKAEKAEIRVGIMRSLKKLVEGGYLERVEPVELPLNDETDEPPRKRAKIDDDTGLNETDHETSDTANTNNNNNNNSNSNDEDLEQDLPPARGISPDDPQTLALLRKHPNHRIFPTGSVWRVNVYMFHHTLRALTLGNLVKERFDDKVPAAGSIITAALKLAASEEHAPRRYPVPDVPKKGHSSLLEEAGIFTAEQLMDYIPTPILHAFQNKAGGGKSNIHNTLVKLSHQDWPQVVMEVEGGRFELATRQMVKYIQGRVLHQVVKDHMGDVAARICSLLEVKGCMETDAIAKSAMVPVQDVREIVHKLYKAKYISYICLNQNKQYISNTSIHLWTVEKNRMFQTVLHNVCTAYLHLRLRRQHEMAVGKDWIERAKEAGTNDENDHEEDKVNYQKFCEGLLRLDNYLLQLDETIMVLRDY